MRISLVTVFLFVIAVAVMCYRTMAPSDVHTKYHLHNKRKAKRLINDLINDLKSLYAHY